MRRVTENSESKGGGCKGNSKDNYFKVAGRLAWAFAAAESTTLLNLSFLMPFR